MKDAYINAKILDPEKNKEFIGDIIVEKDKIIDIGPNVYKKDKPKSYTNVHDCKNLFISPGLLDMRVSLGEPGSEHKESIKSGCKAAFAGGITTVVCLPNTDPVIDNVSPFFIALADALIPMLSAPNLFAASSNDVFVLVEVSKNNVITVDPFNVFSILPLCLFASA